MKSRIPMRTRRVSGAVCTDRNAPRRACAHDGAIRPTLSQYAEDFKQFLRWNDLELLKCARHWIPVWTPPAELCRMPEPAALHVIVSNFHDQLGPKRVPRKILPLAPAALSAWHPIARFRRCHFVFCPLFPGMVGKSIFAIGRQELSQLEPHLSGKTSANADVMQGARIVIKSEQERANRLGVLLVLSKAGNHAVAIP